MRNHTSEELNAERSYVWVANLQKSLTAFARDDDDDVGQEQMTERNVHGYIFPIYLIWSVAR